MTSKKHLYSGIASIAIGLLFFGPLAYFLENYFGIDLEVSSYFIAPSFLVIGLYFFSSTAKNTKLEKITNMLVWLLIAVVIIVLLMFAGVGLEYLRHN